jgi:hypothetical protein
MNENYQLFLNSKELEDYEEKWVVIANKKIVGIGDNLEKLLEKAKKEHGEKVVPFVAKIPKKTLSILSVV